MHNFNPSEAHKTKRYLGLILCLIFIFFSNISYSATYFVSASSGNDNYLSSQARDPKTPWKSIDKVNQFFKFLKAGDTVLFKRGDIFTGAIVPTRSGLAIAPICFGAYGVGKNPEITGLVVLSGWKEIKKGIFETTCNALGTDLIINEKQQQIGRYPNNSYLTIDSHNGNNNIIDQQLTNGNIWTGAQIVIRKTRWIIDKSYILSHTGNTLTFKGNDNAPKNGYGYFIQNNINTLDKMGEWYYNSDKKTMAVYLGKSDPSSYRITTSTVDYLIDIQKINYLNFESLTFTGAGKNTFNLVQAKGISIRNCAIENSGTEAILASYSPFLTVENCKINHSLSGGINLDAGCTTAILKNNSINNTGLMAGMGKSGTGTYEAITSFGDNTIIEKNRIDSVGYNGIYFGGNSSSAKNNYITYFCLTKDDGAGIYLGDWSKTINKKVEGNIIMHGVGNGAGTNNFNSMQAEGIYIDDNTESVSIMDNTVSLCSNNGIKVHNAKDIEIYSNTVFNNGIQLRLEQDHYLASSKYIRNNKIRKNTFFSVTAQQAAAKFTTNQNDIKSFGQIDSNIYCTPKTGAANRKTSMLAKAAMAKPAIIDHSTFNNNNIRFEFNASNVAKIIKLDSSYVDLQNKRYSKTVTLNPYSSLILIASNPNSIDNMPSVEYASIINKTYER